MDMIPSDVKAIVYRFLYDDLHTQLVRQYKNEWAKGWNEQLCYFEQQYQLSCYCEGSLPCTVTVSRCMYRSPVREIVNFITNTSVGDYCANY